MGVGVFFHHIGTGLLLLATILLIVVSVTAPVVHNLAILRVNINGNVGTSIGNAVNFGSFGYCQIDVNGKDVCTGSHIGYQPTDVLQHIKGIDISNADVDAAKILTKVMVLHPVAAILTFLAFLLCLGTNIVGSFIASVFAGLAFICTLIAMACDFAAFAILKRVINKLDSKNLDAEWASGIWCILVAAIASLIATLLVFVTCCAGRSKRNRNTVKDMGY